MSQRKVTEPAVFAIADRIAATGREPTYKDIHDELGGSLSTIKVFLQSWKEINKNRPAPFPVPASMLDTSQGYVAHIWNIARLEAEKSFLAQRQTMEETVKRAEDQRNTAMGEIERLEAEVQEERSRHDMLRVQLIEHRVDAANVQTMKDRLQQLEQLCASLCEERNKAQLEAQRALGQVEVLERNMPQLLKPGTDAGPAQGYAQGSSKGAERPAISAARRLSSSQRNRAQRILRSNGAHGAGTSAMRGQ